MSEIIKVPLEKFNPNPYQPLSRVEATKEVSEYYGKSILQNGLLQTPLARQAPYGKVDEHYEMGDGWLRLAGFKWLVENGHQEFNEIPVEIRELTDEQMAHMVFEANGVRKDLEPIEKAKFFKRYIDEFKVSEKQLAKKFGISQGEVANTLRLLQLPEEIQKDVSAGKVPQTHARELVRLKNKPEKQKEITQEVIKGGVTVKELSKKIDAEISPAVGQLTHGPEKTEKELPCDTCGSSKECEQNLFYTGKDGDILCDKKTPGANAEPVTEMMGETADTPVVAGTPCKQVILEQYAAINSCQSLTETPPKFKGLFRLGDKIYACVSSVSQGSKTIEADCYQVIEYSRWGSYKGKYYGLVGSPIKFIPEVKEQKKSSRTKKNK